MGIATYPSVSSPIKSIQRGSASVAGNITITAVNTAKTVVNSFSTSSSGTVAASGAVSAVTGTASTFSISGQTGTNNAGFSASGSRYGGSYAVATTGNISLNGQNANAQNINLNAANLSGGTTNLVAGVNGAYLVNSTTIYATGPCRYEVIEYY